MKNVTEGNAEHTALYRKYRPKSLADVVGQPQVTEVLRRSLEQGKIAHAYLLTGPKGTGKTSIARILAHEINNLPYESDTTHLDIIEIDAASNNGVDDVRELREKARLAPVAAQKKIYIIDEVHMLSKAAFNALLKTLEEPPAHIVFVLATTDLQKLPATIISRTQHYNFHNISQNDLVAQLKKIAQAEGITASDEALEAIARRGDGSFRNSISLLDQLSGFVDSDTGITLALVQDTLGLASLDEVESILDAIRAHDTAAVIKQLDSLERSGKEASIVADQLISTIRDRLGDQPQLITLLDALIAVSTSSQPQLKLLVVLVEATKPRPAHTVAAAHVTKPKTQSVPKIIEAPVIVVEQKTIEDMPEAPITEKKKKSRTSKINQEDFNWQEVVEYARNNLIALYSVLNKCDVIFDGSTLTLYTGRKFNKTKLDEAKYQVQLQQALEKCGYANLTIETLPTAKPPSDARLAQVAAIMGGGEEVRLDEA